MSEKIFVMKTWRGRFLKAVGWMFWRMKMFTDEDYFNLVFSVRAVEEGLRVKFVVLGNAIYGDEV